LIIPAGETVFGHGKVCLLPLNPLFQFEGALFCGQRFNFFGRRRRLGQFRLDRFNSLGCRFYLPGEGFGLPV